LKKLDDSFKEDEIAVSFKIVDISQNGSISFDEFNKYFCKCVGIAVKAQGKAW
jgi:Ca2+-binding EF-hand superfamily protein